MSYPWHGRASPRLVRDERFREAAEAIGCRPEAIKAVWAVEAAEQCFRKDGSLVRRFEPHHFPERYWGTIGFIPRPGEAPWRASVRLSSDAMFQRAYSLDPDAAIAASSWGAPQIMAGMNHAAAGFGSAREMVEAMADSADAQIDAFVALVERWGLDSALRAHDWDTFEQRYNGGGFHGAYARKMEKAYRRLSGRASPVVVRSGSSGEAVRRLQRAIGAEVDGSFGPETETAVRAFQRSNGLAVDGVVGRQTWSALEQNRDAVPPPQETTADKLAGEIGKWGGAIGSVGVAARGAQEILPDGAYALLSYGAVVLVFVAIGAFLLRRARLG